ncbi:hypothetical protein EZV73_01760 [Acidaminobacter sp. JC074]|uniref:hypothetical protein n=1 Tax=Acidaminobacter sp. JC074 TaxID=2530199 RepID=UPI001F0DFA64|nr:hypothetical protein [Acidaminobacter sp. JC074]MCH4886271.1 hypothetical protein [Acidaminobacter sp. JC074]
MKTLKVCTIIVVLLMLITLVACGGFTQSDEIRARDFFYRNQVVLPLECQIDPSRFEATIFETELDLRDMVDLFTEMDLDESIRDIEIVGETILINTLKDDVVIPYVIVPLKSENRFQLLSPYIVLTNQSNFVQDIMIPIYLIEDIDYSNMKLLVGQQYEIKGDKKQLIDFYRIIKYYEVREVENGLIVKSLMSNEKKKQHFDEFIYFKFQSEEDITYVTLEILNQ